MVNPPFEGRIVRKKIVESGLKSVGLASIRELVRLVSDIEQATDQQFIRMEMGIPGLAPPEIAVNAEIDALKNGVGSKYPPFDGIPELKQEISQFVKNFINIEINPVHCIPTVGSMQGCYMSILTVSRRIKGKSKILFIDPGFPVNKVQTQVIGVEHESFDVYEYRGDKLREKLESYLSKGDFAGLMYSNPNNPSWVCFNEKELKIIGDLCTKYDVVAMEDLAYFGMDFRQDYSQPGVAPFIPTVANYTDNYILMISSSKSFSMAGVRVGMTAISDNLFNSEGNGLQAYFNSSNFGYSYVFGALYAMTSGAGHSGQYGLAAILKAVNSGEYNFVENIKEYQERAKAMRELFTSNGFHIVYDKDDDQPIGDGFYFTVAYKDMSGIELVEELLYYGISAISLVTTGSSREGIRACVSLTGKDRFGDLEKQLIQFNTDHKNSDFMALSTYQ